MEENLDFYCNHQVAQNYLANALRNGRLALFLGNGVSMDLGFPRWDEFVNNCCQEKQVIIPENPNLTLLMEKVRDSCRDNDEYLDLIKDNLYPMNVQGQDNDFLMNKLLISIGALCVGNTRGHVQNIITLNIDDSLEYYFELYGLSFQSYTRFPELRSTVDISIFRPHGLIPNFSRLQNSDYIVLSEQEYQDIDDKPMSLYFQIKVIMMTHINLFIGLSGDDVLLRNVVSSCSKAANRQLMGFWIFRKDKDKYDRNYWKKRSIVRLDFDSYPDYPNFLLDICRTETTNP